MGYPQARLTDVTSHGGVIIYCPTTAFVNGLNTCVITSIHLCPIHGINIVVTGSSDTFTNALPNARTTIDICACTALLVTGSPNRFTNAG